MAWFGESLSSLTGHLQNLTKEVLSEASDETKASADDLKITKEKLEELEAICTAQDLEISALKKQNAELRRRLEAAGGGGLEDEGQFVVPSAPATWLSIEQRCDAGYAAGAQTRGGKGHTRALSDATSVAAKHQERLEKELKDRLHLIEHLELQLRKVEEERHVLSLRNSEQEKQIQQLTKEFSADEHVERKNARSLTQNEETLIQENSELRTLLNDANRKAKEMEEEIISMRNQCLDQVIDSQISASEFRLDVEQTRKRITNETGVQRAERLRAHQDMVNRMIQMGEKTRETEQNVKRLQNEDKHLAAEMVSKIQKLGDQEQQELVHGTLKALELENQVLNMRNVQLEREAMKDIDVKTDNIRKTYSDGVDLRNRNEAVKSEDDMDNLSLQSELSDFTLHSQRLENQIAQLQTQVEIYKRDVKHYEMVRVDLSHEKSALEDQVNHLKELLKEKQDADHIRLTESALTQTESLDHMNYEASLSTEDKLKEVQEELERSKESLKLLHEEKHCFGQELEAMARVVQDLESKIAVEEEEKQALITSMEELDQQHQDALDKLLGLRNCDQAENEKMKIQIRELQNALSYKPQTDEIAVQTEYLPAPHTENVTQTECIHLTDKENQISPSCHNKETCTDNIENKIMNDAGSETSFKYDAELCEKIRKFINFDIPNDFNNTIPQSLYLVQEIVKFANDCKWKKDTLERKVAELIRENNECKSTITILEAECSNLKDNVERLAEQLVGVAKSGKDPLPTILENCEEMEIMEQKNAMLEEEVTVLKETRVNLEEDAARMREERQELLNRIRNVEAERRNQENLETELGRLSEQTLTYKHAFEESEHGRITAETQVQSLMHEIEDFAKAHEEQLQAVDEKAKAAELKNEKLLQAVASRETDLQEFQKKFANLESEKNLLALQLQEKGQNLEEVQIKLMKITEEKDSLQSLTSELQKQFQHHEEISKKLSKVSEELEESTQAKLRAEQELKIAQTFIKNQENLEAEVTKWQNIATTEEMKTRDALLSVFNLEQENKVLQDKLYNEEQSFKSLSALKEQHEKELKEIEKKCESKIVQSVSGQLSIDSIQGLNFEIAQLIGEKTKLQQSEAAAHLEQVHISKQIESLKTQLIQKENIEAQLHSEVSSLKLQISDNAKLQNKYETEVTDTIQTLENENKRLHGIITAMDSNKIDSVQQIEKLDSQLQALQEEKDKLIRENAELKTVILKKYSSQEDSKNHFLENESCAFGRDSDHEVAATTHKSDKETINKDLTLHSNIVGQFTERVNAEKSEAEQLREESHKVFLLLEGKSKEVEVLQSKLDSVALVIEQNKETIRSLQEEKENITKEKFQTQEKFEMTKETVSKLSEMIKEKDQHISELREQTLQLNMRVDKAESTTQRLLHSQEAAAQAIQEHDQLLQTVHIKHQESVQYHAEIQRLSALLSQELAKNQQLTSQYEALLQKSNEEKTDRSPQHLQDVKDLQDLIKMKDEGLQQLCSRLELKQQELHARGMEMETLQHQIELLTYERSTQQAGSIATVQQDEDTHAKYDELLSKLQDEQKKYKQLQNELEVSQGKELSLQRELERLRVHLVEIEDTYTQEALKTEGHIKELVNKLQLAEEMMKSSSTVYKSANIRANQQVETLQEQARLIAQQRDDVQAKLSLAEDQVAKHSAALRNLQAVLEQFQRDREREIDAARSSVYVKVEAAGRKHNELLEEISSLKIQLKEAKEGLSAASRLGEELERKAALVKRLKQEAVQLEEKCQKAEDVAKVAGQNIEGKVDKSLVKNVILGFFLAPSNSKDQVLHVVASVLDFSEDEKSKIQKTLGLRGADGSGSWFKSLLHPAGQDNTNMQSLSEAFVRFLESESIPQPRLKMLPAAEKQASSSTNSPRTTPVNPQRKSPLLLADVQLPTFAQFPVGRNSSSILKDILKES